MQHPLPFDQWVQELLKNAQRSGHARHVRDIGDYILQLFWNEGCEPTITGLLNCAEGPKAA